MKVTRFITCIIFIVVLYFTASCVVLLKENNGKHKGWYKNTNNPHNPKSTNRGKDKGKSNRFEPKAIINKENTERAQPSVV
ncbi:MAG TPA: hypothetical protein VMV47_19280 [Bacteroidales bacterium]|nr:hypothetical protein [Bacteroidales bacterium]